MNRRDPGPVYWFDPCFLLGHAPRKQHPHGVLAALAWFGSFRGGPLRVCAKITSDFGGSAAGPDARRKGGSVSPCDTRPTEPRSRWPGAASPLRAGGLGRAGCVAPRSQTARVCSLVAPCQPAQSHPAKSELIFAQTLKNNYELLVSTNISPIAERLRARAGINGKSSRECSNSHLERRWRWRLLGTNEQLGRWPAAHRFGHGCDRRSAPHHNHHDWLCCDRAESPVLSFPRSCRRQPEPARGRISSCWQPDRQIRTFSECRRV